MSRYTIELNICARYDDKYAEGCDAEERCLDADRMPRCLDAN